MQTKTAFEEDKTNFESEKAEFLRLSQEHAEAYDRLESQHKKINKEKMKLEAKCHQLFIEKDNHKNTFLKELRSNAKKIQNQEQANTTLQNKVVALNAQLANITGELSATKSQVNDLKTLFKGSLLKHQPSLRKLQRTRNSL